MCVFYAFFCFFVFFAAKNPLKNYQRRSLKKLFKKILDF